MKRILCSNREKKSLRHVPMVAKFLDDKKPKIHLRSEVALTSNLIDLIQLHLICQMLAKFSGVESKRTVFKLRKRKGKFVCSVYLLHKANASCNEG